MGDGKDKRGVGIYTLDRCVHIYNSFDRINFQIGLMRGGRFLAEESPETLQSKYQCETLEEVFLKLAVLQNMGKRRRSSIAQEITEQVAVPTALTVHSIIILFN